jgi:hypothetical protein
MRRFKKLGEHFNPNPRVSSSSFLFSGGTLPENFVENLRGSIKLGHMNATRPET